MTLPHDIVDWLKGIHPDPGWAIVTLHAGAARRGARPRRRTRSKVELAGLKGRRALIVVDPAVYRSLPGVSVIPVAAGRALLALEPGRSMADLELAIVDRMESPRATPPERRALEALFREVRGWRRSRAHRFSTRSIILVEHREPRRRPRA
jgi:hypothetical protein